VTSAETLTDVLEGFQTTESHERDGFIRCNTMGHAWHDYDSNWSTDMGTPLTLRCERCGTERRDVVGAFGQLVYRHYQYPNFYRYSRGTRPTRSDFRVMLLTQRLQEQKRGRGRGRR
jgi:hypothetical protein